MTKTFRRLAAFIFALIFGLVSMIFFGGCDKKRLTGIPDAPFVPPLVQVSCCRLPGNDKIWPDAVPQNHRDFCVQIEKANFEGDLIDGVQYFSNKNDCGRLGLEGDQYYPADWWLGS